MNIFSQFQKRAFHRNASVFGESFGGRLCGMRTFLTTLCFLTLISAEALAQDVPLYRKMIASSDASVVKEAKMYVKGLGDGISWANTLVSLEDGRALYCPPDKLALTVENYLDILDRQIDARSKVVTEAKLNETPLGFLLLDGLQETFPCKRGK
jgi:hypothetical protein